MHLFTQLIMVSFYLYTSQQCIISGQQSGNCGVNPLGLDSFCGPQVSPIICLPAHNKTWSEYDFSYKDKTIQLIFMTYFQKQLLDQYKYGNSSSLLLSNNPSCYNSYKRFICNWNFPPCDSKNMSRPVCLTLCKSFFSDCQSNSQACDILYSELVFYDRLRTSALIRAADCIYLNTFEQLIQTMEIDNAPVSGLKIPEQSFGPRELRVPRRVRNLQRTQAGSLIMNEQNLKTICEMEGLYEFPEMNKKIYLHYKVIEQIAGLQKYVNLKSLYLENNVIVKIEGVSYLSQLQNLFLQNNMIKKMENLSGLRDLRVLNLQNNNIFVIQGLSELLKLQNIVLAKNFLSNFASLEHLGHCSSTLTAIDLSDNKIEADERLFDLVPQVKCIYLHGNPLVRQTTHYRRTLVGKLPNLLYLDQRGVDKEQRLTSEAWVKQGEAGFKKAREEIMNLRKQRKAEQREEVMKNIDVHRRNKIYVFERNIQQAEEEINKLRGFMRDPSNSSQIFFYQTRISELMIKIRDNQQFIDSIYKRMGLEPMPPVSTIQLAQTQIIGSQNAQLQGPGMFNIAQRPEEDNISEPSQQSEPSQPQSHHSDSSASNTNSQASSSQPSSVKTYQSSSLQQLD